MTWSLFLDDERSPPEDSGYVIARSSAMAIFYCVKRKSLPKFMSLDHDLGGDDDTMRFLRELFHLWEQRGSKPKEIPEYCVHSENPIGAKNIISYMESWKKSVGE